MANKEWDEATPISNSEWDSAVPLTQDISQPQKMSLIDKIAERYSKVPIAGNQPLALPRMGMRAVGQTIGAVGDAVGSAVDASGLMPWIGKNMPSPVRQIGGALAAPVKSILQSKPVRGMVNAYDSLDPELKTDIESAALIGSVMPVGKVVKGFAPVKTTGKIDAMIDKAIVNGYTKGIKPTVVGKSDASLVRKANDNVKIAVRDIVDNTPVPISKSDDVLDAFSDGVYSTKKKIWQEATNISAQAGKQGAKVDILPVINDMKAIKTDVLLQAGNPNVVSTIDPFLRSWENLLKTKGRYLSPTDAEDLITALNNKAKHFWKDPNSHDMAATVERIAQNLRKQTFDAMEGMEGEAYKDLRKRYGAQLAIEKEVTNRATIYGRKNDFGFFDLANIPAASEFVSALATGRPLGMLKSGGILAAKSYMKAKNDPSNIVRKMFKDVETLNALKKKYR